MTAKVRSLKDLIDQAKWVLEKNPDLGYYGFLDSSVIENLKLLEESLKSWQLAEESLKSRVLQDAVRNPLLEDVIKNLNLLKYGLRNLKLLEYALKNRMSEEALKSLKLVEYSLRNLKPPDEALKNRTWEDALKNLKLLEDALKNLNLLDNALNKIDSALLQAKQQKNENQKSLENASRETHIVLEIDIALSWLMNAELSHTPNEFSNTCRLQHVIRQLAKTYISCGSLIVAALILKIPYNKERDSHPDHTVLNFAINRGWLAEQREISYTLIDYEKSRGKEAEPFVKPRFDSELYSLSKFLGSL